MGMQSDRAKHPLLERGKRYPLQINTLAAMILDRSHLENKSMLPVLDLLRPGGSVVMGPGVSEGAGVVGALVVTRGGNVETNGGRGVGVGLGAGVALTWARAWARASSWAWALASPRLRMAPRQGTK